MSIGFEADRSVVALNDSLGLSVAARNDSLFSVKAMHVELVQVSTWFAHGLRGTKTRTVASIVVPGSALGKLRRATEGNKRRQSFATAGEAARRDLEDILASGAGFNRELLVPDTCLSTLQTDMIQVRHSLSVRLKTPHYVTSPDVWTPLRVQQAPMFEGHLEATLFMPSSVNTAPYAAVVEPEADVTPKPVLVPQSAVTLECSNELPGPSMS